eukprot:2498155-Rhodomonas_salina.1
MECTAMVSFNDRSAGKDAQELAVFLTQNGIPTFCTRVYCPQNSGDWRKVCEAGAATCALYIPLMTNGWQMSLECQAETVIAKNRAVDGNVTIFPVWYDCFDKVYDVKNMGHFYAVTWKSFQACYRERGGSNWKQLVLDNNLQFRK